MARRRVRTTLLLAVGAMFAAAAGFTGALLTGPNRPAPGHGPQHREGAQRRNPADAVEEPVS